jgi:dihydrofolate synthase/folylpolyglutamate synthase
MNSITVKSKKKKFILFSLNKGFKKKLLTKNVNKMTYREAIDYLYKQLPMYQRIGAAAYKNNLDNTLALDKIFDHPHKRFRAIHVAGTNGKGSVSHMLASVLQSAGYKVGLYTSPHLKDFRERIKINGELIREEAVCNFIERFEILNANAEIKPSFFELTVLMAFNYFANENIDIAVVEVGLGGRLDSTNIISPVLSVITNISLDHTNLLGNSLEAIAREKAGIIKSDTPVVIGEYQSETAPVFSKIAEILNAPIIFADNEFLALASKNGAITITNECGIVFNNLQPDLTGSYQQKNILTTAVSILELRKAGITISDQDVFDGIKLAAQQTGLMGRWQTLQTNPLVICDTAHNEAGINWVTKQIEQQTFEKLHIVFGTVNDKAIDNILALLPKKAKYYFTQAGIDRALDAKILQQKANKKGLFGEAYNTVNEAYAEAMKTATINDFIFIGGSTFVVAEVV